MDHGGELRHPQDGHGHAWWGPSPPSEWPDLQPFGRAVDGASQVDVYQGLFAVVLVVMHGVPDALDPLAPGGDASPWKAGENVRGGVQVFRHATNPRIALLTRGSTWMALRCTICSAVETDTLASIAEAGPPPTLSLPDGVLVQTHSTLAVWAPALPFALPFWLRHQDDVRAGSFVVYAGPVARRAVSVDVTFDTASEASEDASDIGGRISTGSTHHDPRALLGDHPSELLAALLQDATSAEARNRTLVLHTTLEEGSVPDVARFVWR